MEYNFLKNIILSILSNFLLQNKFLSSTQLINEFESEWPFETLLFYSKPSLLFKILDSIPPFLFKTLDLQKPLFYTDNQVLANACIGGGPPTEKETDWRALKDTFDFWGLENVETEQTIRELLC